MRIILENLAFNFSRFSEVAVNCSTTKVIRPEYLPSQIPSARNCRLPEYDTDSDVLARKELAVKHCLASASVSVSGC